MNKIGAGKWTGLGYFFHCETCGLCSEFKSDGDRTLFDQNMSGFVAVCECCRSTVTLRGLEEERFRKMPLMHLGKIELPYFEGFIGASTAVPNNPADITHFLMSGPCTFQPVGDERLNLNALLDWRLFCAENKLTVDFDYAPGKGQHWSAIERCCVAGRARIVFEDSFYKVVFDDGLRHAI